jgi:hypothetical protein
MVPASGWSIVAPVPVRTRWVAIISGVSMDCRLPCMSSGPWPTLSTAESNARPNSFVAPVPVS